MRVLPRFFLRWVLAGTLLLALVAPGSPHSAIAVGKVSLSTAAAKGTVSIAALSEGTIPRFNRRPNPIALRGPAQPGRYMEASGRDAAFLGDEGGGFEAWVYPLKVLHDLELGFGIESYNRPIPAANLASEVDIRPETSTVRYSHAAFTVDATWLVPFEGSSGVVLLDIDTSETVTVTVQFRVDLRLMWPAGLGGQYSYWDDNLKAFVLGEGSRKHAALVGSPLGLQPPQQPAHNLPDAPSEFTIRVTPENARRGLVPIVIAASVDGLDAAKATYEEMLDSTESLYLRSFEHYRRLREEYVSIDSPDDRLDLALEWGKVAMDKGFVCNPQLGCGLIAGLGRSGTTERPGFGWFFGGDAFMNMWAMTAYGDFETVRDSLLFLRDRQRDDGKMMHELSQGADYIDWFGDYPYGYYHADTTPLYISAARDYVRISGDLDFAREIWPSVRKAYEYCSSTDEDGDGLMDNTLAGLAAVETGALRSGEVLTDVYLAAAWTMAAESAGELALVLGEGEFARQAQDAWVKARAAANARFLDNEGRQIFFAILRDGQGQAEPSVWMAWGLWKRVFDDLHPAVGGALDELAGNGIGADWGARMLSRQSALYEPLSYNNGAVWPFLTGFAILALYEHDRAPAGWAYLDGTADLTFLDARGYITELLSGDRLKPIDASVPHQLFATSGLVSGLLRGLVGLKAQTMMDADGGGSVGSMSISPQLQPDWDFLHLRNLRWQGTKFDVSFERERPMGANGPSSRAGGPGSSAALESHPTAGTETPTESLTVTVSSPAPAASLPLSIGIRLPPGAEPLDESVRDLLAVQESLGPEIPGEDRRVRSIEVPWLVRDGAGGEGITVTYRPGIELKPVHGPLRLGDRSTRMRVIDAWLDEPGGSVYSARLEGLAGKSYQLELDIPFEIESLEGAREIDRDGITHRLEVTFPAAADEAAGEWQSLDLVVTLGSRQ